MQLNKMREKLVDISWKKLDQVSNKFSMSKLIYFIKVYIIYMHILCNKKIYNAKFENEFNKVKICIISMMKSIILQINQIT